MPRARAAASKERRTREARLGIRVDRQTKQLVARAARLEHRSLTDFWLAALSEAARQTIAGCDARFVGARSLNILRDSHSSTKAWRSNTTGWA